MHVLENVYFVYICSIFSLHCFVQFAENKDIVLYCIAENCYIHMYLVNEWFPGLMSVGIAPTTQTKKPLISLIPLTAAAKLLLGYY